MSRLIRLEDAIEVIAQTDITDGTEPVFSGKQVIGLLKDLDTVKAVPIEVLQEIRQEIAVQKKGFPPSADYYKAINRALNIIDKHIKEYKE